MKGSAEDAGDVRVDGWSCALIRKTGDGSCGVAPYPGQPEKLLGIGGNDSGVLADDLLCQLMKVGSPAIIAQTLPAFPDPCRRSRGQRTDGGIRFEKPVIVGLNASDLGLLQHELGDENVIGISSPAPRQIASVPPEPPEEQFPESGSVRQVPRSSHRRNIANAALSAL